LAKRDSEPRIKGGSDEAARAVRRHANAIGAVAMAILRDSSLAEDVIQETSLRATRSISRQNQNGKLGGYLVGIAHHVARDMARKRRRETRRHLEVERSPGHQGLSEVTRSESRERLEAALAELPRDQREVFLMKYVAGMRYSEIASTLDLTEDAVSQKLWRVRQKLQKTLEDLRP